MINRLAQEKLTRSKYQDEAINSACSRNVCDKIN